MKTFKYIALASIALFASLVTGCSHAASASASGKGAAAYIGTWKIPGEPSVINMSYSERWLRVAFKSDGTVHIVIQPGYPSYGTGWTKAELIKRMKPTIKDLTYDDLGNKKLRITFDTSAVTYTYDVKDDKLYLSYPPEYGGSTDVFERQT